MDSGLLTLFLLVDFGHLNIGVCLIVSVYYVVFLVAADVRTGTVKVTLEEIGVQNLDLCCLIHHSIAVVMMTVHDRRSYGFVSRLVRLLLAGELRGGQIFLQALHFYFIGHPELH